MASSEDDKKEKRQSKIQPNVLKLLDCPICYGRITPPVTVCHNGHAVCNPCRKQILSCPVCKAQFSANKNTILDQIIEENIFACKYTGKGCKTELKLREIEEHEQKQCIYRTILCMVMNSKTNVCTSEISISQYYDHVNMCHRSNTITIDFTLDTKRTFDTSSDYRGVQILKDVKTSKIVFEVVKLDRANKRFYITYIFVGITDEANRNSYEIKLINPKERYKELKYKSLCVPLGITEEEMEDSERCLVLSTSILPNFTANEQLIYTVKFETVSKKWYKNVGRRLTGLMDDESFSSPDRG